MLAGLFVLLAGSASAQSQDIKALAQEFGQSAKQNAMALRMYAWQTRVEITLKGEPKPAKLFAMRFDPDGVVQKTALNPAPPEQPTRGLKGSAARFGVTRASARPSANAANHASVRLASIHASSGSTAQMIDAAVKSEQDAEEPERDAAVQAARREPRSSAAQPATPARTSSAISTVVSGPS